MSEHIIFRLLLDENKQLSEINRLTRIEIISLKRYVYLRVIFSETSMDYLTVYDINC